MNTFMAEEINNILYSFNIKAKCVSANRHRHFFFYDLELDPGCKISKVNSYATEIALALKSKTAPIIKPIIEKGVVRLQVSSQQAETLHFEQLYWQYPKPKGILPFLFGETDEGKPLWIDMASNPHLLVAGSTGSGKSVFLHNVIANAKHSKNVRLCLIDPKKVEFNCYKDQKYSNFILDVATSHQSSLNALRHIVDLMENRFTSLSKFGLTNVTQRPDLFDNIIVIIDEVADFMFSNNAKEFENMIVKLSAKARASGIFLVLATQRPSVDVLTGVIKSNFPARLACRVSSKIDSKVILDATGAENLLGKGDALFKNNGQDLTRFQIAFVDPTSKI